MQNLVSTYLDKFKKERRVRHRLTCILLALALIVGTGVYWQMRLTGAAATNETFCGLEEHTHTEDCYEKVLACGLEESEGHTHTDACYEEKKELVCGLEESEGHTHTDDCYDADGNLICDLEESEGHTHTDACYETEKVLVCDLEESEGHTHTEACYEEQLTCGLEEHTHTVECLIDETADVETADEWEDTLPTELTGVWADDVVAVAKSQVGYTESTANFTLDDDGETRRGYTRYGAWAGNKYGDWDAMFASFCLHYAGISKNEFPEATGAYSWSVTLKEEGLYESAKDYTPVAGDLVFFDTDDNGKIDSVGIVIEVKEDSGKMTVVEGDYAKEADDTDAVCKNKYAISDSTVIGYGTVAAAQELEEESAEAESNDTETAAAEESSAAEETVGTETTEEDAETEEETEEEVSDNKVSEDTDAAELTEQTLTATVGSVTVTVSGQLPEGAVVTASPVTVDNSTLDVLLAVDISIYYADGSVFEPEDETISVTIESDEIDGDNDVYYIAEDGDTEKMDSEAEEGEVEFDAEHFSTYAVTSSDTVIATGTMANGEGVEDAITWTIYEDDAGNRYLLVEGEGSIPDYASQDGGQPWYSYRSTNTTLIIGEGITRIGNNAFRQWNLIDIQFSSTVTSIGQYAFAYGQVLTSVTIPGNIKTVEQYAFAYSYKLTDVTLEEGVETLGTSAFGHTTTSTNWITIPASLTSFGNYAFEQAAGYIVAEENTTYSADEDGVLYSYDGTTLIDYPKSRVADSWTIPESVTTVQTGALQNVQLTNEIYVMYQVSLPDQAFRDSNYTYVYIADDVTIASTRSLLFYSCSYLTGVHLPENTTLVINNQYFNSDSQLASLKIPQGTTKINKLAFSGTTNLETLYYDAAHVTDIDSTVFGTSTMPLFDLSIGTNVDYLVANFSYILAHANTLTIEGPNAFYVEEGAFDNAPAPYTGLSGWIYVTEDGVVYTLDTETNEATLYYVPDGLTSVTIPATITDTLDGDEAVTFTITTVAKDAIKYADDLTSITFEDASKITTLEAYALANAPIESVTDSKAGTTATTVSGAEALFTNAAIGYNAFYNTELDGSVAATDFAESMDGSTSASVGQMTINVISGSTTEWTETDDDDSTMVGGYTSLTGDMVKFSISVNNTSGSAQTYRVYVQVTDDDCSLNYTAGETFTVNGVEVTCSATDDPYTICLEFTVEEGQTVNFSVNVLYPTPTSDGGGVTVWGTLVSTDEEGNETETKTDSEIDAYWTTQPDTYTLAKENNNQASVSIAADEDGTVRPSSELKWKITLTSDGDQSDYGEDYVTYVTYTDVLTLPTGMEWDEDILEAIKAGNVTTRNNSLYVGSTQIVALSLDSTISGLSLSGVKISYDEETGQVILTWKVRNTSSANLNENRVSLTVYPAALTVDMNTYDTGADNTITNTVTTTVNYTYSSPKGAEASVDKTVTGGAGTINLSKTGMDVTYFGEDLTYTLKIYNDGGLPYTDSQAYTLTDALESSFYISPENMEKMFTEAAKDGTTLVIMIANAKLAAGSTATDTDGNADSALVNTGNSDLNETTGNMITISYDSETKQYTVTVTDGSTQTGTSLESMLQNLGYGVTSTVTYTCVWTLPMTTGTDDEGNETTTFTLAGGGSYTYNIYATVKSTFQKLDDSDWPGQYPKTSALALNNSATLLSADSAAKVTAKADSDTVIREAIIAKSVSLNGEDLGSAPDASDGDVLDYTLTFTHYGDGSYDDLPMVDDLYGSQYLLVPVSENSDNTSITGKIWSAGDDESTWSGVGVTTYDEDGDGTADYYVLSTGTYTNVVVGQDADSNWMTAATITVSSGSDQTFTVNGTEYSWSGIHTQIKWYFDELEGGDYVIQVSYKALVDTDNAASYTLGNIVWMNDRSGSRIYASLWGGGTIIGYDKDIVVEENSEGDEDGDGLDDDKFATIFAGEIVTYRLKLESTGDSGTFTLTGANIADQLPNTYGVFAWTKENVSITGVETASGTVDNADSLATDTNWSISESYNGISGTGTYFIVWDDEVSVTFHANATIYIYATVTYPSDTEETTDDDGNTVAATTTWSEYVDAAQGTTLTNVFYVYRNPANVTHVLAEEGEATLQKGVYALARSSVDTAGSNSYGAYYATGTDRDNYNNQDSNYRYVVYYVSLYNGASTRLYLNDLYDLLPEGFTYVSLVNSWTSGNGVTNTHKITTLSSSSNLNSWLIQTDSETDYMSAGVSANVADDGTLVFTISSGSGTYAIKYDEDMGQYYLDKGEAIAFGYICQIGTADETEDTATNTIAMSYTDYTGAGVTEADKDFKARVFDPYNSNNDGDCTVDNSATVKTEYGFDDGNGNRSWLVSDVMLVKGGIKPGVDKETVSYQSGTTSSAYTYTNSVTATDLVDWKATLINGGSMSIVDYTVTDTMPNPYVFTGDVAFTIYDSSSETQSSGTLFTINTSPDTLQNLSGLNSSTLSYLYVTPNGSSTATTVYTDGTEYTMSATVGNTKVTFTLSLSFDDNNNLVMTIGMTDTKLAIPEGGTIEITYSSWNPTTSQASTTYINQVTLTPSQSFTSADIQNGSAVTDVNGNTVGVSALSPVTVTSGYATNAYKSVTEKSTVGTESENTAVSTDSDNSIALSSADSVFTYTLYVENVNDEAITKLVLIDNLPYVGDTYTYNDTLNRNSEFAVVLDSSDFVVTITKADGTVITLTAETDYTVEYSTTEASDFSEDDRSGTSTWSTLTSGTDLSTVKSIRVIIITEIPAGATVSVSFDAKVSNPDSVDPGSIAWNNFGYRYKVTGLNTELEAMPLVVGVKVPSAPELTKKLVDLEGNAYTATKEETFTFVVYKGGELTVSDGSSYATQSELTTALEADDIAYKVVTVTVKAGSSQSEKLVLTGSNGLSSGDSWWTWEDGAAYTIAEFLSGDSYALEEWDSGNTKLSTSNPYTFTYDRETTLSLTCTNTYEIWDITLTKVDADSYDEEEQAYNTMLNGAVFALYTQDEASKMSDEKYGKLTDQPAQEITVGEGQNKVTWFLCSVQATADDGTLSFTGLTEDSYYLVEVKAPDGYNLNSEPILVKRDSNSAIITITNEAGYELPKSGGIGTWLYTIVSLILCSGAVLALYRRRRSI